MNSVIFSLFTLLSLFGLVACAPIDVRDVFVPPIFYPNAGTVWKAGSRHNVTWDVSHPPAQITNGKGMIVLAKGDRLIGISKPMAKGFDILLGRIEVSIPEDTLPGDDYSVVVFGDSGNNSQRFTITN